MEYFFEKDWGCSIYLNHLYPFTLISGMAEQRNTPLEGRRHPSDDLLSSNPQLECLIQDSRLEVLIPNTLKPNTSQHGVRKTTRMWNHPTIGKWWEVYLRATFSPGDVSQPPKSWVLRQPLPTYVHDVRAVLAHKEIPEDYRKVCQGTSVAGNVMCGSPIKNRPKSDDIHCCSGSRQPNVTTEIS